MLITLLAEQDRPDHGLLVGDQLVDPARRRGRLRARAGACAPRLAAVIDGLGGRDQAPRWPAARSASAPGPRGWRRSRQGSFGDQEAAQGGGLDALGHEGLADAAGQDEGQRPPSAFLSCAMWRDQAVGVEGRPATSSSRVGRPAAAMARGGARGVVGRAQALGGGEAERQRQPSATASPCSSAVAEAGLGLQRMAEGVAEVEQGAAARSRARPRRRSRPSSPRNARRRGPGPSGSRASTARAVRLQPVEEGDVAQQAVLDAPRRSRARISRSGRVASTSRSASTRRGWWKAPIRFLPRGGVDGGLAADRGIHLGQQGGGDLHEVDAALVDRPPRSPRGRRPRPPPKATTRSPRSSSSASSRSAELGQAVEALGLLARRHDDQPTRDAGGLQRGASRCAVQAARPSRR